MVALQHRPLYSQVRDEIAQRIAVGAYPSGSALPNEFVLSQEFQVSIGTVRKAVDQLVTDRALSRQQGRGTFVMDRSLTHSRSEFDRVRNADGSHVPWRFLHAQIDEDEASATERARLALADRDARVLRITRAREADSDLVMHEVCTLPAARFPFEPTIDSRASTIIALAARHGVIIGGAEERVRCGAADEEMAELFDVEKGAPILHLDRIVFDHDGVPVEWRIARCCLRDKIYVSAETPCPRQRK